MTRNSVRALECGIIFQNWPSYTNFDPPHIFVHPPVIEEKNIKGDSGGPKPKKKFEKTGGLGGVQGVA